MSRNDRRNWLVFAATLALTGGLTVIWLAYGGIDDERILTSTRYSAQLAFALYLVVLVARPLQQLLRRAWTAALLHNRRLIGVAFAATMTTHLALIAYRFGSQPDLEYPFFNLLFGGSTYAIFYLMLITSFDRPRKAIGPRAWKMLHRAGLVLAGAIFGLPRALDDLTDPDYLRFGIPFTIAVLIRVTAWLQSRQRDNLRSAQ